VIRILNIEPDGYSPEALAILEDLGEVVNHAMSRADLLAEVLDCDVLIVRLKHAIDRDVIDQGKRLKAIVSATTGLDHIDVAYANDKGIRVLALQGESEFLRTISATAEHTWGLLLALVRRIPSAFVSVRGGGWDRDLFRGTDLVGKRLGIMGLGRIGGKVACYGKAFAMDVAAYDPYADVWVGGVSRATSLSDLIVRSDVFSVHVPLKRETRGLVGRKELDLLPRGAILINTSRGEVIDEGALVQALEVGHLAGAAVDVIAGEQEAERREESALLAYARTHDNLLITPHIAGATVESMAKTEIFMARKLVSFMRSHSRRPARTVRGTKP